MTTYLKGQKELIEEVKKEQNVSRIRLQDFCKIMRKRGYTTRCRPHHYGNNPSPKIQLGEPMGLALTDDNKKCVLIITDEKATTGLYI